MSPSAIWVASAYRTSTASTTSSAEQAQIESWAALRTTSVHASAQLGRRPAVGVDEEGGQRLGRPLQRPLGPGRRLLDVDPVGRHAHQQVGPCARPQLARPRRAGRRWARWPGSGGGATISSRWSVLSPLASATTRPSPAWAGWWSVAVHPQQRVGGGRAGRRSWASWARMRREEGLGVVGDGGAVGVADGQVLGPHRRPVGGLPPERGAIDGRGDAPPHHRVLEAGQPQELGHLGHVAEHVGQVADLHGAAERRRPLEAHLQVADERLAGDEELVGQHVPGADGEAAGARQAPQAGLGLGPHRQVVVDHRPSGRRGGSG